MAVAGCWLVLMDGRGRATITGSRGGAAADRGLLQSPL